MFAAYRALPLCNAVPGHCVVDAMAIVRVGATRVRAYTRNTPGLLRGTCAYDSSSYGPIRIMQQIHPHYSLRKFKKKEDMQATNEGLKSYTTKPDWLQDGWWPVSMLLGIGPSTDQLPPTVRASAWFPSHPWQRLSNFVSHSYQTPFE